MKIGLGRVQTQIAIIILICTSQFIFSARFIQPANDQRPPFILPDSQGYIDTARYFLGESPRSAMVNYRLFGPVIPFLAAVLNPAWKIVPAYLLLNYVLLLLTSFLLFYYFRRIFSSDLYAYVGTTLFATSMPIILWAPSVLVDMGAWFGISLLLLYSSFPSKRKVFDLIIRVFLYSLAVLIKPTLAFIVLFCFVYQFFIRREYRQALFAGLSSTCLVLYIYLLLGLSVGHFTQFGYPRHRHALLAISAFAFAFNSMLVFSVIGIGKFRDVLFRAQMAPRGFIEMNLMYLISSLTGFLIFVHTPRLAFIAYPFILTTSICGLAYLSKRFSLGNKLLISLVLLNAICSNFVAYIYQTGILLGMGRSLVGASWG